MDFADVIALLRRELRLEREMRKADDGVHRRADFVAHVREEHGFHLRGFLGFHLGLAQFGCALLHGLLQILIQFRQTLLPRPDFARHFLETARKFAQFVAALREFAQHFLLEISLLNGGCGARETQERTTEAAGDECDNHHHGQQSCDTDERGSDGQLAHGREDFILLDVEDNLPASQWRGRPVNAPLLAIHRGFCESLGFRCHRFSTGSGLYIGAGKTFAEHEFFLQMHNDLPRPADKEDEFVGAAPPVFLRPAQPGRPHHRAEPVQGQVHGGDAEEVRAGIEHGHHQSHHGDIGSAFIKVRFRNVKAPGFLGAAIPFPFRVVIVVIQPHLIRPALAIHPRHCVRFAPVFVFESHGEAVGFICRHLGKELGHEGNHAGVGLATHGQLAAGRAARQHAHARNEIVHLARGGANLGHGLGVGLLLQFGAGGAVVEPHGQSENQPGGKANAKLKPTGDAVMGKDMFHTEIHRGNLLAHPEPVAAQTMVGTGQISTFRQKVTSKDVSVGQMRQPSCLGLNSSSVDERMEPEE